MTFTTIPPEDERERRLRDIEEWLRESIAHDAKPPICYQALAHANYLTDMRHSLQSRRSQPDSDREAIIEGVVEQIIATLERRWKTCMDRGDQRGTDMAHGVNGDIEVIKTLYLPNNSRSLKHSDTTG